MPSKDVKIKIKKDGTAEPGKSDQLNVKDDVFINLEKQLGVKNIKIDYKQSYVEMQKTELPLYDRKDGSFYFTPLVKGKCKFYIAYSIEIARRKSKLKTRKKTKRKSSLGIASLVVNLPHILDGGSTAGQLNID